MWFVFAILSALFYSALWILTRMSRGIPSAVVTSLQFLFAPFIFFYVIRTLDYPWGETWFRWYLLVPFVVLPFMFLAMTYALHRMEVTMIKPIFGLSSFAALFVGSVFFNEEVTLHGIVGLIVIASGLLLLYHGRWSIWKHQSPWIAFVCSFVAGTTAAIGVAALRIFPEPLAISALVMIGAFLMNGVPALPNLRRVNWSTKTIMLIFFLAIAGAGQDLMTVYGLAHGPSAYVIAIKRISILLTAIIGYVFLKERDQSLIRLLAASGLVVVGVVLLTML